MSRKVAEAERDRILAPLNAGLEVTHSTMTTVSDFIDHTFLDVKRLKWRADSTEPTSIDILNNHLKPTLGSQLIHLVTRKDLQALLTQKAETYSYSLVQHLHSFIREIFAMAYADRLIQVDPAPSTIIPRCKDPKPKPTIRRSKIEEVAKLLPARERLMFWLATLGGGMRPSEVQGLKVGDIKPDRIGIERRVYRGSVGRPKNFRSERFVPLTDRTKILLKHYRKVLPDDSPEAWLFPSENLKPSVSYSNVYRRCIKPALLKSGVANINYQAMRRTFSSQADTSGVDAKTRSDIMGHSVDVNVNQYTQKDFELKGKAMQQLEEHVLH